MLIILTLLCWHANTIQSTARADGNFCCCYFCLSDHDPSNWTHILMMVLNEKIRESPKSLRIDPLEIIHFNQINPFIYYPNIFSSQPKRWSKIFTYSTKKLSVVHTAAKENERVHKSKVHNQWMMRSLTPAEVRNSYDVLVPKVKKSQSKK